MILNPLRFIATLIAITFPFHPLITGSISGMANAILCAALFSLWLIRPSGFLGTQANRLPLSFTPLRTCRDLPSFLSHSWPEGAHRGWRFCGITWSAREKDLNVQ